MYDAREFTFDRISGGSSEQVSSALLRHALGMPVYVVHAAGGKGGWGVLDFFFQCSFMGEWENGRMG